MATFQNYKLKKRILSRLSFIKLISLSIVHIRTVVTTASPMLSGWSGLLVKINLIDYCCVK